MTGLGAVFLVVVLGDVFFLVAGLADVFAIGFEVLAAGRTMLLALVFLAAGLAAEPLEALDGAFATAFFAAFKAFFAKGAALLTAFFTVFLAALTVFLTAFTAFFTGALAATFFAAFFTSFIAFLAGALRAAFFAGAFAAIFLAAFLGAAFFVAFFAVPPPAFLALAGDFFDFIAIRIDFRFLIQKQQLYPSADSEALTGKAGL
jgi:hypothetical protein